MESKPTSSAARAIAGCSRHGTCRSTSGSWTPTRKKRGPPPAALASVRLSSGGLMTPAYGLLVPDALLAVLAGPYPDRLLDGVHEHAPVADRAGAGRGDDRLDGVVGHVRRHHGLHLDLRQERDVRPHAAVLLGVALLAPAAHHLAHGEAGHAQLVERVLDLLEPVRPDDRLDLLHLL